MPKFNVAVSWQMMGTAVIEAVDLDDAMTIARRNDDIPLPDDACYVDDSWKVDYDCSKEIN